MQCTSDLRAFPPGDHSSLLTGHCSVCGADKSSDGAAKLSRCGKCNEALYCSRECQVKAWPAHKKECKKGPPCNLFTDSSAYGSISLIEMPEPRPSIITLSRFAQQGAMGQIGLEEIAKYVFSSADQLPVEMLFFLACGFRPDLDTVKTLFPQLPIPINEIRLPGTQFSALEWASRKGHEPIVRWLITEGKADVNMGAPVAWACYTNRVSMAKMLVEEYKADPQQIEQGYGRAAVHLSAENGSLDALKWLIEEKGISAHTPDRKGMSPLACARACPSEASDKVIAYLRTKRYTVVHSM